MCTIFEIDIINDIHNEQPSTEIYYDELYEFSKKRSRKKFIWPSPLWFRDDTHRLQRKPLRRSTSLESAMNEIEGHELTMTDCRGINVHNSTPLRTPGLERMEHQCRTLTRNQLRHWQSLNQNIFSSTMINNDCYTTVNNGIGGNTPKRNHRSMMKIFDSWIEWTPFWSRDEESKRLDRRHYISDFLDI